MSMLAAVLAAALTGLAACGRQREPARRLSVVRVALRAGTSVPSGRDTSTLSVGRRRLLALVGGVAVTVLVGGVFGLVLGVTAALGGWWLLGRADRKPERDRELRLVAELPVTLDLLASCLSGGCPLDEAVRVVAAATDPVVGEPLAAVAAALAVGTPPEQAWARFDVSPETATVGRAVARACAGGTVLAGQLHRLATEQREVVRARAEQLARRAGVLVVAPLGLCFLPAFLLVGVVPVIAGLARGALSGITGP